MKQRPRVGDIGERRVVVTHEHAIDFAVGGMPAVLATPWLIWFLEHAAREAVLPCLDTGESTVGLLVEIEHLAATPVGAEIICQARVVQTDGKTIAFQLEAWDRSERVARGFHKLRVVDVERFAARVKRKAGQTEVGGAGS